jgi:mannose-6-phosphate isomerase-like protein (cupin superfamily)
MKARVNKMDPSAEYFFAEGCFINEFSSDQDDPNLSIAQARLEPGCTTRWHLLRDVTERYVIQSGTGYVEVENMEAQSVGPGDVVRIPPGARQRIKSTGSEDLIFLALCTPRFSEAAYVDVEEELL